MNIALRINRRQTSVDKCPLFLDLPTRLPDLSDVEDELLHYVQHSILHRHTYPPNTYSLLSLLLSALAKFPRE